MSTLTDEATSAAADLIESDEDQLLEQLGIRIKAIESSPTVAGSFDPHVTHDSVAMGPLDAMRELGLRIFNRWEREAYGLACGTDAEDTEDRKKILTAFGLGASAVAGALAATMVSWFALAPAIAAVIAALIIKRFFRPVAEEFCAVWGERLA